MPIYKKYQGNYQQIMDAMSLPELYQQISRQEFNDQLDKDRHRSPFVSFDTPLITIQSKLYNHDHYDRMLSLSQGDLYSATLKSYFVNNDIFRDKVILAHELGQSYENQVSFCYLDDNNVPCGVSIERFGIDPVTSQPDEYQKYVITLTRNTTSHPKDRKITMICEDSLFPNNSPHPLLATDIEEKDVIRTLETEISSSKVFQLLSTVVKNGKISKIEFEKLSSRITADTNLDNRDIRGKHFQKWLEIIHTLDPELAEKAKEDAQHNIHFFETTTFETLLFDTFLFADNLKGNDLKLAQNMYTLQLQYLLSNLEPRPLTDKDLDSLWTTMASKQNTAKQLMHEDSFKSYAQFLQRQNIFEHHLHQLENYVHECPQPYKSKTAADILTLCRTKIDFNRLSDIQQNELINCVSAWPDVEKTTKFPIIQAYEKLIAHFQTYGLAKPELNKIMLSPEEAKIDLLLHHTQRTRFTFDPQARMTYDTKDHQGRLVTISTDYSKKSKLYEKYLSHLRLALTKQNNKADVDNILVLLDKLPTKNNITPLQQNLHIMLGNIARTYQTALHDEQFTDNDCAEVLDNTMHEVSKKVCDGFARALLRATKSITNWDNAILDVKMINETLAIVEEEITQDAKKILLHHIGDKLALRKARDHEQREGSPDGRFVSPSEISRFSQDDVVEATQTTPILHVDNTLGLATWVEPKHSRFNTNHNKVTTYQLGNPITTIPQNKVITPTFISSAKHLASYTREWREQLLYLIGFYDITGSCTVQLSSFNKKTSTTQIKNMLLATHDFNRFQLIKRHSASDKQSHPLCYLQANGVESANHPLGYRRMEWSGLSNEITLMTEMALLNQLNKDQEALNMKPYVDFLARQSGRTFWEQLIHRWLKTDLFSQTLEGYKTKLEIQAFKYNWQQASNLPKSEDMPALVTKSLQKIMAFDLHFETTHSPLMQILSSLTAQQSIQSEDNATRIIGYEHLFLQQPINPKLITALQNLTLSQNKASAKIAANELRTLLYQLHSSTNQHGATMILPSISAGNIERESIEIAPSLKEGILLHNKVHASPKSTSHTTMLQTLQDHKPSPTKAKNTAPDLKTKKTPDTTPPAEVSQASRLKNKSPKAPLSHPQKEDSGPIHLPPPRTTRH